MFAHHIILGGYGCTRAGAWRLQAPRPAIRWQAPASPSRPPQHVERTYGCRYETKVRGNKKDRVRPDLGLSEGEKEEEEDKKGWGSRFITHQFLDDI